MNVLKQNIVQEDKIPYITYSLPLELTIVTKQILIFSQEILRFILHNLKVNYFACPIFSEIPLLPLTVLRPQ